MYTPESEYKQDNPISLLRKPSTQPAVEATSSFEKQDRKILSQLAAILDDGYVFKSSNLDLGEIELRKGKKSTGLTHIIVRRFEKKVLSKKSQISSSQAIKEITAISFLIAKSLENCPATVTPRGNWNIENQGIVAVIDKDKFGKFVLTGFEWNEKRQEATESISTVIAQYGYTPEFLEMYAQVGAVLTSYGFSLNHNTTSVNTSLEQGATNNTHQAGKGVYMGNDNAIAFQEQSTGRILVVEELEKEYEFDSTLYNKDMEMISERRISTLFDKGDRDELTKACNTAMELHGVEKTDVLILDWPPTNTAHQAGKGVYMSNEFAQLEDQYLEQMANGGASDRALEEDYLEQETNNQEQESQKENGNLYSHGQDAREGQRKPYYQQQAESLLEAVKGGRVPFLPQEPVLGEDGKMVSSGNYSQDGDKLVITPRPAVRMLSGNILTGVNQLTAQIELDRMGRKSQTVLTWEQAKAEGCFIKKGAQSFVLTGYDKDAGEGQSKSKVYHVFAAGDVSNSKIIQGALNKNANANAPKPWTKEVLGCHDGTPAKFLGTYMAASATGAKFETDRATVQQFQQQFTQMMEKSIEEKQHTAIFEVGRNAQKYASVIRDNSYKQWEKAQNKEKETNTRNLQQRAMGMEMGL